MPKPGTPQGAPNEQELEDFKNWVKKNYPFGFVWSGIFGMEDYRSTSEYQQWLKSRDYEAKYMVSRPGELVTPEKVKAGIEKMQAKKAGQAPAGQTAEDALAGILGERGNFVGTTSINGWLVPIYRKEDGSTYQAWEEARQDLSQQTAQERDYRKEADYSAWIDYRQAGGTLGYEDWVAGGYEAAPKEPLSPYDQRYLDLQQQQLAENQRQFNLEQQYAQQAAEAQRTWEAQQQQNMIGWYQQQEQMRQEEQRQQRLATLRANPTSWLEYSSLAGTTPMVQPWMMPMAKGTYGGETPAQWQIGAPLPGWTAQSSGQSLQSLPSLGTPSAQYLNRLAPSSQQQYAGYERARTGASPEDLQWLLSSTSAPGGYGSSGLRWMR